MSLKARLVLGLVLFIAAAIVLRRPLAERYVQHRLVAELEARGMEASVASVSWTALTRVDVHDLCVDVPDARELPPALCVDTLSVELDRGGLFGTRVTVQQITLHRAVLDASAARGTLREQADRYRALFTAFDGEEEQSDDASTGAAPSLVVTASAIRLDGQGLWFDTVSFDRLAFDVAPEGRVVVASGAADEASYELTVTQRVDPGTEGDTDALDVALTFPLQPVTHYSDRLSDRIPDAISPRFVPECSASLTFRVPLGEAVDAWITALVEAYLRFDTDVDCSLPDEAIPDTWEEASDELGELIDDQVREVLDGVDERLGDAWDELRDRLLE